MSNRPPTNGEYYDHERQTWMVQCGNTAVAICKLDAKGRPVEPPKKVG